MELIFDTSVLSCFARAGLLDLLERLTAGHRRLTAHSVLDELQEGVSEYPRLADVRAATWIEVVQVDTLEELRAFARYTARFGMTSRDIGEASALAFAEVHRAIAVLDDQTAVQVARERNVEVRRSLSLIASGVRAQILSEDRAAFVVDRLIEGGARFPCSGSEFVKWARERDLFG